MPFGATPSRWCVCQFHHFRFIINNLQALLADKKSAGRIQTKSFSHKNLLEANVHRFGRLHPILHLSSARNVSGKTGVRVLEARAGKCSRKRKRAQSSRGMPFSRRRSVISSGRVSSCVALPFGSVSTCSRPIRYSPRSNCDSDPLRFSKRGNLSTACGEFVTATSPENIPPNLLQPW
jgi:hypothetical protein